MGNNQTKDVFWKRNRSQDGTESVREEERKKALIEFNDIRVKPTDRTTFASKC